MNFRAVSALCEWANQAFKTRFPANATLHSPGFAALDPKDEKGKSTGGIYSLTHACDKSEVPAADAWRIAGYIRSEVDGGRRKFGDFLILTRKKGGRLVPYAQALEALNIPIEVSGAGAFGESAEVEALTVLLRALADPQDTLSLIAVGWFSVFWEPSSDKALTGGVPDALTALARFYRWTRVLPAAAALDRILEQTGFLALAATTPGGVEAGDVVHAVDRVRQVVEDGGSLADAADALEADREAASEVESLPLEPGRTDVVRLMNLHKAKGLEADVVFLADPVGGFQPRVDVHIERRGLKAQGWFKLVRRSEDSRATPLLGEHADWAAHEAAEQPYLDAEEDRLLYVAATAPASTTGWWT
jgi:ATP-dependent helicase/nuclease subunit A